MKKRSETIYNYKVVFGLNGDGYTVTVPKLPGLVTEGDNLKDARMMVKDAIRCYLESVLKEQRVRHNFNPKIFTKRINTVGV